MQLTEVKCVFTLLILCAPASLAEKQYKSPEEFELYTAVTKDFAANDFAKVLAGLDTWEQKYPGSDFASNRQQLYVQAYARAGQPAKAIEAAQAALAGPFDTPDDQLRLIYAVVTAVQQLPSPGAELRAIASEAARQLKAYDRMPAGMQAEEWQMSRRTLQTAASVALLHIALTPVLEAVQAKDCLNAEALGTKAVEEFPDSVQAAWVLASAELCLARTTPAKFAPALYLLARATALDPVKGMVDPSWQSGTAAPYFKKMYTQYHGPDPAGLQQLKAAALASPLPPHGFSIASAAEIEQHKQADLESKHPELALWLRIKGALTAPNGQAYFESELKDVAVPVLSATLVEATPACRPTSLKVAISNPDESSQTRAAEILLKLARPLTGNPEIQSSFRFEGVPTAFTRQPFLLTMNAEPEKLSSLRTKACAASPSRKRQ